MIEHQSAILAAFSRNRAEVVGASRFFGNEGVTEEALIRSIRAHAGVQAKAREVLAIQDTSEINYAAHSGLLKANDAHLGPVGNNQDVGFFIHPTLVLDAQSGFALGFADLYLWNRRWDKGDKETREYKQQPIEAKESYRWIESGRVAKSTLAEARHVTIIADREADIYEEFVYLPDERTDVLIRSRADRQLVSGERLGDALERLPSQGEYMCSVGANNRRKPRSARIEVRFAAVEVLRPKSVRRAATLPASIKLYAVEAREMAETVPRGEAPILWSLLTSRPVNDFEQALTVINFYRLRPQIEQVFRLLKSQGLHLEESRIERGTALKKLAIFSLAVALVLMQLVSGREGNTEETADVIFTEPGLAFMEALQGRLEGKTERQRCPHRSRTLAWASWVVARLGGWTGYARAAPPGPITMRRGLERLQSQYEGWLLAQRT
jgi:Transposase DDE domain